MAHLIVVSWRDIPAQVMQKTAVAREKKQNSTATSICNSD